MMHVKLFKGPSQLEVVVILAEVAATALVAENNARFMN